MVIANDWWLTGKRTRLFSIFTTVTVGLGFLVQLAAISVDMNVHYFRLLREGIIVNVDTYHFPNEMYFRWRNSPLKDRLGEVSQITLGSRQASMSEKQTKTPWLVEPRLDFWWSYNLAEGTNKLAIVFLMLPFLVEILFSISRIHRVLKMSTELPVGDLGS